MGLSKTVVDDKSKGKGAVGDKGQFNAEELKSLFKVGCREGAAFVVRYKNSLRQGGGGGGG